MELSWEGISGSGEGASSGEAGQFWDRAAGARPNCVTCPRKSEGVCGSRFILNPKTLITQKGHQLPAHTHSKGVFWKDINIWVIWGKGCSKDLVSKV